MASLCAPCARADGLAGSDFAGWLPDGGLDWGLCEGCGWHLVDDDGNPGCGCGERVTTGVCVGCLALAGEGDPDPAGVGGGRW